jgi:uncharacterized protein YbaR (Trm112 family)
MISNDLLEILRCPIDPGRSARLRLEDAQLVCQRCAVRFKIKDGFPVMVAEEALLPPGCDSEAQLPCKKDAKPVK